MISKFKWIIAAIFLATLMPAAAYADGSMRCGSHIISAGERNGAGRYEVLKKCGEPTDRSGNTWVYEKSGGARHVVVFDASGRVSRIN